MRIAFINTSDIRGGAAIAAYRLFNVTLETFPDSWMLVREKLTDHENIRGFDKSFRNRLVYWVRFILERLSVIPRVKKRAYWFSLSPANFGRNISRTRQIRKADILHLHWINQGYLSLRDLKKLCRLNKPIVWTLHDMWAFTGGCHYSGKCSNYIRTCGNCFFLKKPSPTDFSHKVFKRKQKLYQKTDLTFVAPSHWMAGCAKNSGLIGDCRIEVIGNPIDTEIFRPGDQTSIRNELGLPQEDFLILCGAANLMDTRKGFGYLLEALRVMGDAEEKLKNNYGLITFGKSSQTGTNIIPVYPQAYLSDNISLAKLYQAADVYVLPSLEDNLPGTVMESLACGTPVVAFRTGGISDMVDHLSNGYLADLKSVDDLIKGIRWVKNHPEISLLKENGRKKVLDNYSQEVIAEKFFSLYNELLKDRGKAH